MRKAKFCHKMQRDNDGRLWLARHSTNASLELSRYLGSLLQNSFASMTCTNLPVSMGEARGRPSDFF